MAPPRRGGAYGYGTVYRLTPPAAGQAQWSEEILHSFSLPDGVSPSGTLAMDSGGNLYGTTSQAGPSGLDGLGTVFKLSNVSGWALAVLHDFGNGSNGGHPGVGVIFGPTGLLYGVTTDYGTKTAAQTGTVFSVSPVGSPARFALLHEFGKPHYGENGDGYLPTGLQLINGDTLIGTCLGSYGPAYAGDIFQQKITADGKDPYDTPYFFNLAPNVGDPVMPPLPGIGDYKGVVFGVAESGGAYGYGGIYTVAPAGSQAVQESVIYSFGSTPSDGIPSGYETLIKLKSRACFKALRAKAGNTGKARPTNSTRPPRPEALGPRKY